MVFASKQKFLDTTLLVPFKSMSWDLQIMLLLSQTASTPFQQRHFSVLASLVMLL